MLYALTEVRIPSNVIQHNDVKVAIKINVKLNKPHVTIKTKVGL